MSTTFLYSQSVPSIAAPSQCTVGGAVCELRSYSAVLEGTSRILGERHHSTALLAEHKFSWSHAHTVTGCGLAHAVGVAHTPSVTSFRNYLKGLFLSWQLEPSVKSERTMVIWVGRCRDRPRCPTTLRQKEPESFSAVHLFPCKGKEPERKQHAMFCSPCVAGAPVGVSHHLAGWAQQAHTAG